MFFKRPIISIIVSRKYQHFEKAVSIFSWVFTIRKGKCIYKCIYMLSKTPLNVYICAVESFFSVEIVLHLPSIFWIHAPFYVVMDEKKERSFYLYLARKNGKFFLLGLSDHSWNNETCILVLTKFVKQLFCHSIYRYYGNTEVLYV